MKFNFRNAADCDVYNVTASEELENVTEVDCDAGTVTFVSFPLRLGDDGEFVKHQRRFASCWPIYESGKYSPTLIHCRDEVVK